MKKLILLFTVALLLAVAGCASLQTPLDDDYQFGDLTNSALTLQAKYCAETEPAQRAVTLALMNRLGVPLPPRGACSDLLALIPAPELDEVDIDAAREDQERYQEALDAGRNTQAPAD